jgi:hypothetical protein
MREACEAAGLSVQLLRSYTIDLPTAELGFGQRLKLAARESLRGLGVLEPRLPKYLGVLCEIDG